MDKERRLFVIVPRSHNLLDRACVGHCYNYGNYEPGSGQFRVRAVRENSIVTTNWIDTIDIGDGRYLPTKSEQPLLPCILASPALEEFALVC